MPPSAESPWDVAYLPIDPRDLGRRYEEVVRINSQSGKGGVLHVLEQHVGITLPRWMQIAFSKRVQAAAETSGGEINADAISSLFDAHCLDVPAGWQVSEYQAQRRDGQVRIEVDLGALHIVGGGDGLISAVVNGLGLHFGIEASVEHFDEFSLSNNTNAEALACVQIRHGDCTIIASATANDTTLASIQAVVSAWGRLISEVEQEPVHA